MNCNKCGSYFTDGQMQCPQCGELMNSFGEVPTKKIVNLLGIAAAIMTAVGVFLPAVTVKLWELSESAALIEGYGKFILGVAIAFAILVLMKKEKLAQGLAFMSSVLLVFEFFNEKELLKEYEEYGATVGLDIGFYICLVGSIVMFVSPFIWNKFQRNKWGIKNDQTGV